MSEFNPESVERFDCELGGYIDDGGEYACMVGSPTGEYVYAHRYDALLALLREAKGVNQILRESEIHRKELIAERNATPDPWYV